MNLARSPFALLVAVLVGGPCAASADDDLSDLAGLLNESVVSTASKSAETAGAAPASTYVITSDDIRRFGFTTLDQAINFVGGGMLTERSWGTPEIGARGVLLTGDFGNHVLLLIDGHAVNEPWDATAYYDQSAGIPLDMVDHVELILGPGSVLYGSSAMLGVINVITKRAKDYQGLHFVADGGIPTMVHLSGGYGQTFEWAGHAGEITMGVDLHQTLGPNATFGLQPYGSGVWGGDATNRSVGVPSGYLRLIVGDVELSVRAAQSKRAATEIWGNFDDPNNWERDRWLSVDARWSKSVGRGVRLGLRAYGDLYDYLENNPTLSCLAEQDACTFKNSGVSRWGGAEANVTYDWLADSRYVTLVGVDVRYRHVSSWSSFDDASSGTSVWVAPYDKSYGTVGAYLQQTATPFRWLSLNAGARLDYEQNVSHLSPRLAAVVPAWTGGTVKAIYAEAFRAPSFYERYYSDNLTQIAAPDLKPETVRSIEAVVEQRLGAQRFRVSGFHSWWSDMVLMVDATQAQIDAAIAAGTLPAGTTAVSVYGNASSIRSYGMTADWEASAVSQRLRLGASVTVAQSRRDDTIPLAAAAQLFGNARMSYDLGGSLPTLALAGRFVGPRPVSGSTAVPTPDAPAMVELHGAVTGPIRKGFSYRVTGTWSSSDRTAYAVGPARDLPGAILPAPRFQLLVGLRYDGSP